MVRNYADPDDDGHPMQARQIAVIDALCIEDSQDAPMANAIRSMTEALANRTVERQEPGQAYFSLTHNVGILGRILGGGIINAHEMAEIIDFCRRDLDSLEAASEPGLRAVT